MRSLSLIAVAALAIMVGQHFVSVQLDRMDREDKDAAASRYKWRTRQRSCWTPAYRLTGRLTPGTGTVRVS